MVGLPLLLAWYATPAGAQVLNTYFEPTGTPAGGIPADQSSALAATGYEPRGIHLGTVVISPLVLESVGYDSNVNGLNQGSSATINTSAFLVARSEAERYSLSSELLVEDQRYTSFANQDSTAWSASVGGTYKLGHDQLGLGYSHLNLVETADQIGAVTAQPVSYRVDTLSASYTADTGSRISLQPGFELRQYGFDPVPVPGTGYTEATRDRSSAQETLVGRYELSPDRDIVLALTGTEISYSGQVPGAPRPDSDGGSALAGLDYAATGVFRYRVLAGYQTRHYRAGVYGSISAPVVEASVTWQPTRLTTLVASARRDIEDSLSEAITGYTYTAGRLDVTHELRRNILLAGYVQAQFAGTHTTGLAGAPSAFGATGSDQTIYSAGASLTLKLKRGWRLTASEAFSARTGQGAFDYQDSISSLALGLAL